MIPHAARGGGHDVTVSHLCSDNTQTDTQSDISNPLHSNWLTVVVFDIEKSVITILF